jgi:hypothetical protein
MIIHIHYGFRKLSSSTFISVCCPPETSGTYHSLWVLWSVEAVTGRNCYIIHGCNCATQTLLMFCIMRLLVFIQFVFALPLFYHFYARITTCSVQLE